MNIEQRVDEALVDLRAALGDGAEIDGALVELAAHYDLKPEVLRIRAKRAFGGLNSVKALMAIERAAASREALLWSAFAKYRAIEFGLTTARDQPVPDTFAKRLEKEFGFSGAEQEGTLAYENERNLFYHDLVKALDRKLNAWIR